MNLLAKTTTQLIEDLREPGNALAWSAFDARYRPVLTAFARRLGFDQESAGELAQNTLCEFARAYSEGRYQRGEGRLSSWLLGIARNVGANMRRARGINQVGGDSVLSALAAEMSDDGRLTQIWIREREHAILGEAMSILRESSRTNPETIRAFELFAIQQVPATEVAAECGISVEAVYVIKNRLTRRLREIARELTTAYDEGE